MICKAAFDLMASLEAAGALFWSLDSARFGSWGTRLDFPPYFPLFPFSLFLGKRERGIEVGRLAFICFHSLLFLLNIALLVFQE